MEPDNCLTYHSRPELKERLVSEARDHMRADRYTRGTYFRASGLVPPWRDWEGCAVGCTTAPILAEAEGVSVPQLWGRVSASEWCEMQQVHCGIPRWLGRLQDYFFERLSSGPQSKWPLRFLEALPVGADVSPVADPFLRDVAFDERYGVLAVDRDTPWGDTLAMTPFSSLKFPIGYADSGELDGVVTAARGFLESHPMAFNAKPHAIEQASESLLYRLANSS